jgi:hypothetical protein
MRDKENKTRMAEILKTRTEIGRNKLDFEFIIGLFSTNLHDLKTKNSYLKKRKKEVE